MTTRGPEHDDTTVERAAEAVAREEGWWARSPAGLPTADTAPPLEEAVGLHLAAVPEDASLQTVMEFFLLAMEECDSTSDGQWVFDRFEPLIRRASGDHPAEPERPTDEKETS